MPIRLLASLSLCAAALFLPQAYAAKTLTCKGYVSFREGTMEGYSSVTFTQNADGSWYLDFMDSSIYAGFNKSTDPNKVVLKQWRFWRDNGVWADYDSARQVLKFGYKYNSGVLGGGGQHTKGVFNECEEGETSKPRPRDRDGGRYYTSASHNCADQL